jgi:hypothetical protein
MPFASVPAAGGSKTGQRRNQVSKKARQQVLVQAADRVDEVDEAGCLSDDDWLLEQMPPAAAGSQQVVKVVYKVCDFEACYDNGRLRFLP